MNEQNLQQISQDEGQKQNYFHASFWEFPFLNTPAEPYGL